MKIREKKALRQQWNSMGLAEQSEALHAIDHNPYPFTVYFDNLPQKVQAQLVEAVSGNKGARR